MQEQISQASNGYFIAIEGENGVREAVRLDEQDLILQQTIPGFPDKFTLETLDQGRILDLGCGSGGWVLWAAHEYPEAEVIGVDINNAAIKYCNAMAASMGIENAEFRQLDILHPPPLDLETDSYDLINVRFMFGVLPITYWEILLQECLRVLKPGGTIRLVESVATTMEGAPHNHELGMLMNRAFYEVGKTSSPYELGVVPLLNRLLRQSYEQVRIFSYYIDYSAGTRHHKAITEDFAQIITELKPLLSRIISSEELDEKEKFAKEEFAAHNWSALWNIGALQAKKPQAKISD